MSVVIVKYNAGNIHSVELALKRLGINAQLSNDPQVIQNADKVIFPGQGEASSAMRYLQEHKLVEVLRSLTQPFLGICLGLQLMCRHSDENNTSCLGIYKTDVKRFNQGLKTPQIGWNKIHYPKGVLFKGIKPGSFFYFLHSFYAQKNEQTIAETDYGLFYASAMHQDNFYAVQFHPEKSGKNGEQLLKNFLEL